MGWSHTVAEGASKGAGRIHNAPALKSSDEFVLCRLPLHCGAATGQKVKYKHDQRQHEKTMYKASTNVGNQSYQPKKY
ncbi:MAG TPA: hypothetical protein V6C89_09735 [Drouetiella sp.]|jgi:hypothetical protein